MFLPGGQYSGSWKMHALMDKESIEVLRVLPQLFLSVWHLQGQNIPVDLNNIFM